MLRNLLSHYILIRLLPFCLVLNVWLMQVNAQSPANFRIVGYYSGPPELVDSVDATKLTHIIFSFGHLEGNRFHIGSVADTVTIQKMVALKRINPDLKVMLSLGGWSGCATCSDVFNTATGRVEFAQSVRDITAYFQTDGLDLDWEYPAIPGYPGHNYRPEDKDNFTSLVREIRRVNHSDFELSFAAGGFTTYIDSSIDWRGVAPYLDFINIMTYDLVHGYSKVSGHHTPLYSTPQQTESTDHAVQLLLHAGVPPDKLVIGAAFYGRFFKIDDGYPVDLYQPCHFDHGFSNRFRADSLASGFDIHWDSIAQAPYAINTARRLVATYDDEKSMGLKIRYALHEHLGGIMFWQLCDDRFRHGLLEAIWKIVK